MSPTEPKSLAPDVAGIAQEAAEAILAVYGEDFDVNTKADESPLTNADLASHRVIVAALTELTPDIPVLSEESSRIKFQQRSAWPEYWLVDPLDGTKEFVSRNGEFTVNIALIRNHRPVLGVVFVPVSGLCYCGFAGGGATRQEGSRKPADIRVRVPHADPLVIVGSRSHANPDLEKYLRAFGEYELISIGSSLKCCLVAEGTADFYPRLGPTFEWDTAAAQAVVEAAGGRMIRLDGTPLEYNQRESLTNPEFLVTGDPAVDWLAPFAGYPDR